MSETKFNLLKDDDMNWFCTTCWGPAIQTAQTDKLIEDRCKHYICWGPAIQTAQTDKLIEDSIRTTQRQWKKSRK